MQVIQQSGLLESAELTKLHGEFQERIKAFAESQTSETESEANTDESGNVATKAPPKADAKTFAQFLIEKEALSRWQAQNLLLGKHKGFKLGKYKLLSLLGKGGMSSVYLAEHMVMKRRVAIKVLPHKKVHDASYLGRFHREAQAVAALDHSNIVRAYDVDAEMDGKMEIHFLVMEFVEGQSLQEYVADEGTVSPIDAADFIRQAADGLEHAHQAGLVHRDIKPGNLLVDKQGVVKLLDLGLARFFDDQEASLTVEHDEKVLGTADYLSPEQAVDSHSVDHRADLYSLGCTLYFLLTGQPPFNKGSLAQRLIAHQTQEPPSVSEVRKDVPESLILLMQRLMSKKPDDRPKSAAEASQEFSAWLAHARDGGPTPAPPTAKPKAKPKKPKKPEKIEVIDEFDDDFLETLDSAVQLETLPEMPGGSTISSVNNRTAAGRGSRPSWSKPSSNIHGRGPSSVIKKESPAISPVVLGAGVGVIVLALGWFLFLRDDTEIIGANGPGPVNKPAVVTSSGPTGDSNTARPPVTGNVVTVGPEGNFATIAEAVEHLRKTFAPATSSERVTIRLKEGSTHRESTIIDSRLDTFPKYVTIESPNRNQPAKLVGDGTGPVLTISNVEELTVRNLVLDANGATKAVSLNGTLNKTTFSHLEFRNFTIDGLEGVDVTGAARKKVHLEHIRVTGSFGRKARSAIRFVSAAKPSSQIRIRDCRLLGPISQGISLSGKAEDIFIERNVFDNTDAGVHIDGGSTPFDRLNILANTFHRTKNGIFVKRMPGVGSRHLVIGQNLFSDVGAEFRIARDFRLDRIDRLFTDGGWIGGNYSTRTEPDEFVDGDFRIVEHLDGYRESFEFLSFDPSDPDYLRPQFERARVAYGGLGGCLGAIHPDK